MWGKKKIFICVSSDAWVKSGFDWSSCHHRLCFITQQREKKTALRRQPCWKENTSADASNTGRRCWCPVLSEWTHNNKQGVQKCELLPVYYITFYRLREIFLILRDKHPKTGKNRLCGKAARQTESLNRFNPKHINKCILLQLSDKLQQTDIESAIKVTI